MKKSFAWAERKERAVLYYVMQHLLKPNKYEFSPIGSKEPWDFKIHYKEDSYVGDIKCLNTDSEYYNCLFLEDKKVKNLLYSAYKCGYNQTLLYVSWFKDHKVNVLKIDKDLLSKYNPKWRTVGEINKLIYFIPKSEGRTFNLGKLMMDYASRFIT